MSADPEGVEFVRPRVPHHGSVHLADASPEWPRQYAAVAARIRTALAGLVIQVEHAGSTSVPGLAAKPIIDVLLLVPDATDEAAYVPALEAAELLLYLREPGWHQHRLLRCSDPPVNLHVFSAGSEEAERMLLFRDRLRTHPEERERYERLKRQLATRHWVQVQDYADAKSAVVEEIIARARRDRR